MTERELILLGFKSEEIKEYDEDENDWDKLSEEGLDDIDDWKE